MILQALKEYYDRKAADPDSGIAPEGWEKRAIPFLVVINGDGKFICFQDTRESYGKQLRAKEFTVPSLGEKKGNGIKANLFWENIEYMFGVPAEADGRERDPGRVVLQHQEFCRRITLLRGESAGLDAVRHFIKQVDVEALKRDPLWDTVLKVNQSLLFALEGSGPVTEENELRDAIDNSCVREGNKGRCIVSGELDVITSLEPPVRGVRDANPMGASLVSVNNKVSNGTNAGATPAFSSFLKEQGHNSPIGKKASFAYTTALNTLLGKDSRQKLQVGDATTVFWSAKRTRLEEDVCAFFNEPPKDNPDQLVEAVRGLYKSVETGAHASDGDDTCFYVLGLSPNAARIAVRFWHCGTVAEMADRFCRHFSDMLIVHGPKDRDYVSLWRLLVSTAALGKSENIPPNLAGDTMRAILEDMPYPATLLQAVVRRLKAEHEVTHARAALLKAVINRLARYKDSNNKEEMKVSLDTGNTNIGYRLGRLFAALEKIQADAQGSTNATIRDKFYGSASGTPASVFGTLMRLKNHHLAKLPDGFRITRERLLGEIMAGISDFPPHLTLEDQGRFAIGYYHQMQDFYTKKEKQD